MGSPKQPAAPEAPDYAAANREGILTDIETLPQRRQIDVASRLGQAGTFMLDGEEFSYDFTGLGDADVNEAQLGINRASAFGQAQDLLDIQDEFGQRFLETSRDQLKASDPIGFALREKLGETVTSELDAGRTLSDSERRGVQQSTRASQTARGNTQGVAAGVQEVLAQSQFGEQRFQQRQQNAAAFLSGTTPLSQFGQLRSAGAGAAPFASLAGSAVGLDRNAGAAAAAFSQQTFGTQSQIYNTQMSNQQSNPWMEGLGMAAGLGGQLGSAKLLCWVAREVYGEDDPKWKEFRSWVLNDASEDFREFYIANGEELAKSIKKRPAAKAALRKWMDSKIGK